MTTLRLCDHVFDGEKAKMFDEGFMTDVVVVFRGEEIPAHAAILASASSYFRSLLCKSRVRSVVPPDCCRCPTMLKSVLRSFYCGDLYQADSSVGKLCDLVELLSALGSRLDDKVLDEMSIRVTNSALHAQADLDQADVEMYIDFLTAFGSDSISYRCLGRALARLLQSGRLPVASFSSAASFASILLRFSEFGSGVERWGLPTLVQLPPFVNEPTVRQLALKLCCLLPPGELLRHIDPVEAFSFWFPDLSAAWALVAERACGQSQPPNTLSSTMVGTHWLSLLRPGTGMICRIRPKGMHASFRLGFFTPAHPVLPSSGAWLFECGEWAVRPRTSPEISLRLGAEGKVQIRVGKGKHWQDSGKTVSKGRRAFVVLELIGNRRFPPNPGQLVRGEKTDGTIVFGFVSDTVPDRPDSSYQLRTSHGNHVEVVAESVCKECTGGAFEWMELLQLAV